MPVFSTNVVSAALRVVVVTETLMVLHDHIELSATYAPRTSGTCLYTR